IFPYAPIITEKEGGTPGTLDFDRRVVKSKARTAVPIDIKRIKCIDKKELQEAPAQTAHVRSGQYAHDECDEGYPTCSTETSGWNGLFSQHGIHANGDGHGGPVKERSVQANHASLQASKRYICWS